MRNNDISEKKIIVLAYLHRYGWGIPILAGIFLPPDILLWMLIICFLGYAIWSFVGYKCKWKHIYCSYQNSTHQKMTPNSICWDKVKKVDAYGLPIFYLILVLVCVFMGIAY